MFPEADGGSAPFDQLAVFAHDVEVDGHADDVATQSLADGGVVRVVVVIL